jgi:hypothetical protein
MSGRLAFNLLLLAAAAYFVWSATGYEPQARQIPILIGVMVLVLQAWVTIKEALATEPPPTPEGAEEPPPTDELARVAAMCGWMLLYLALFAVLGTLAAGFFFIWLFLAAQKGVRWWTALAVALAMSAAIWLVFARLMRFELYPGILFGGTLPSL